MDKTLSIQTFTIKTKTALETPGFLINSSFQTSKNMDSGAGGGEAAGSGGETAARGEGAAGAGGV